MPNAAMGTPVVKNLKLLHRQHSREQKANTLWPKHEGWRPKTREDCKGMGRPCPFVGCQYNLFLDVNAQGGVKYNFGEDIEALAEMDATCALDVADRGGANLQELGDYLNVTRERARQIEESGMKKLQANQACDFRVPGADDEYID